MVNSTAVRCPPIVMSPCTVATTSSPFMLPLHTHGHALYNFVRRHACRTGCLAAIHTCVRLGRQFDKYYSSCWSVKVRPPHVDQCQYLALTFACCDLRQHDFQRLQWRCRRIRLLACVLYSFETHLARTLGFPGCPLSVSAHPVSMAAFPVSRKHTSLLELTDVLYLFTSCLGTQLRVKPTAFVVVTVPSFPRAEQLPLFLTYEFLHLGSHETQSFALSIFMDDAAYPVCILRSLPLPPASPAPARPFFQLLLNLLWRLGAPMFPFAPSFRSCLRRGLGHADACWFICFAYALRLVARWLSFARSRGRVLVLRYHTQPSPNMHKSATPALVPGMAMIFTTHFMIELASGVNSCTKYSPCAACASYSSHRNSIWSLSFLLHLLFRSLSDPNDDVRLTASNDVSHFIPRSPLTKSQFVMSERSR